MNLSAVIITFNEQRNIGRCLDSLAGVVDEVVVVDSFSTDDTEKICRAKGARFVQHAFEGHIEQKNWALAQAQYPHVLSLDADEALSETLRKSVLAAKSDGGHDGYSMNRLTNYCGQWIYHSGWYPDRKLRLFDRRKAGWGGTNPHDRVEMQAGSTVSHLSGDLLHYSYYSVGEHLERDLGADRQGRRDLGRDRRQIQRGHAQQLGGCVHGGLLQQPRCRTSASPARSPEPSTPGQLADCCGGPCGWRFSLPAARATGQVSILWSVDS